MDPIENRGTIEEMLCQNATMHHIPINGILELTPLCNMNCNMCYVRLSTEEMQQQGRLRTAEEWISIINEMKQAGTLFVLLTGGEPLTHPGFKEIYLALKQSGMVITINTNGTLIDEQWADFFAQYPPRRINITLYGKDNDTYQKMCHFNHGFDKTIHAIHLLKERNIDVKVNGSITPDNIQDLDELISIVKDLDVAWKFDTYMYPAYRERNHSFIHTTRLTPKQAALARTAILKETDSELFKKNRLQTLQKLSERPGDYVYSPVSCRAGRSSFVVNWQGKIRPCIMLTLPEEPLFEQPFLEAWNKIVQQTSHIMTSPRCNACSKRDVCQTCAACAKLETGRFDGVPQYMCDYTEEFISLLKESH